RSHRAPRPQRLATAPSRTWPPGCSTGRCGTPSGGHECAVGFLAARPWSPRPDRQFRFPRGLLPFPRGLLGFPRSLLPFPRGLLPFPRGLLPFPRGLLPFPRGLLPFPRGLLGFPRSLVSFSRATVAPSHACSSHVPCQPFQGLAAQWAAAGPCASTAGDY